MVGGAIYTAKVMHKRLFPKINKFQYHVYYIKLPLKRLDSPELHKAIAINKPGLISFHEKDHGPRDGSPLLPWIENILAEHIVKEIVDIQLICMPRIFGYVFNPISYWLCLGKNGELRAILCEVHNTFGEAHCYLCMHQDQRPISQDDWLKAEKLFHVSPFLAREGCYHFRFALTPESFGSWIDYYDAEGKKQLITSLVGSFQPLTKQALRKTAWKHPLVTLKAITLIHWQALKLFIKGIKYRIKPEQLEKRQSKTDI